MKNFILLFLLATKAFSADNISENTLLPNCVYFWEKSGELSLLDSRLAKEKFPDVEWIDSDKSVHHPPLIIKLLDKEFVGHTVLAGSDIARGNFVAKYEGEFSDEIIDSKYSLVVPFEDRQYCICSEKKGGVARFIQHGPRDLEEYDFKDLKSEEVAICNLQLEYRSKEQRHANLYALMDIKKFEIIALNYGKDFWITFCNQGDYEPRLFRKNNGQLIPKISYTLKTITIIVRSFLDENDKNITTLKREVLLEKCKNCRTIAVGPPDSLMVVKSESIMDNIKQGRSIFWLTEIPNCYVCHQTSDGLKKCGGCRKIFYCSTQCQTSDWTTHKLNCKTKQ